MNLKLNDIVNNLLIRYLSFTNFECKITAFSLYAQVFIYVVQHKSTALHKKVRVYLMIISYLAFIIT